MDFHGARPPFCNFFMSAQGPVRTPAHKTMWKEKAACTIRFHRAIHFFRFEDAFPPAWKHIPGVRFFLAHRCIPLLAVKIVIDFGPVIAVHGSRARYREPPADRT